jgi:GGDEF domain-containing protein
MKNDFEISGGEAVENKKERSVRDVYESALAKKAEYDKEVAEDVKNLAPRMLLDKLIENFPSRLKDQMLTDAARLIDRLGTGRMVREDVISDIEEMAKKCRESYIDGYGMLNDEYGKMAMMNEVDKMLDGKEKNPEVFKRMAIVYMDVNALKAVNELAGHAAGDAYLHLVVDIVNGRELTIWAEARRLKIIPIHKSGDEFYLIVIGEDGGVQDVDLEELQELVEKEVYSQRKAAALVDLTKDDILYKLYSAEQQSADEPIEPASPELFTRLRQEIPTGFEFRAALATGAVNLYDALEMDKKERNIIKDSDNYEKNLAKMMGSLKDVSEDKVNEKKKGGKIELAASPDSRQRMLARLYNFREAGIMKIKQEKEAAEKRLSAEEEKKQTARKMREDGVPAEQIVNFLLEK